MRSSVFRWNEELKKVNIVANHCLYQLWRPNLIMPSRSEGRESSSRRSRSRRNRSRHRDHHRHHRTRSRNRAKNGEKNFPAAVCNMLAIVLVCTSLAEPKWISLQGGGCMIEKTPLHHLGTYQFFFPGKFLAQEHDFSEDSVEAIVYQFGPNIKDS